uniref:EGF-like domain-containing protein n=1 Tax=Heterorhabditis bacteriophora TaxID=37862 RepID=A0A1I7X2C6_HETBA
MRGKCPSGFYGFSCELLPPLALPLSSQRPLPSRSMVIIFAAVLFALFVVVFMMVRGCFCDCFGPMMRSGGTSSDQYDKPLDPEDVKKCLQKFRAHEARQEMVQEQQHPLISTISNPCAAPYNTTVLPSAPPPSVSEEEVVHKPPELFPVITPGFYGEENITKEMGYFHDYENESSWVTSNYEYQNRYSDTGEVNNYSFNVYRLTEHIYMFNIFQLDLSLLTYVMIDLKISDAECFSSATESSFIVFLATLTFDNKFVSWMSVRSEQFEYFENERVWIYNVNSFFKSISILLFNRFFNHTLYFIL